MFASFSVSFSMNMTRTYLNRSGIEIGHFDLHVLLVGVNELGEVCIAGEVGDHLCFSSPSS